MSTAEFQRLALLAAGVDPSQIPSILDTATWRRLMIVALNNCAKLDSPNVFSDDIEFANATNGVIFRSGDGTRWRQTVDYDGITTMTAI